tara:strand:+ start:235 stop:774 length:540 start_codon:yes stop_codon:yes gene_type:complete
MGLNLCKYCYEDYQEDNVIMYDNRYTEKFYKMNIKDLNEEELNMMNKNLVIDYIENIGNVIMFYSNDDKSFKYYSNKKVNNNKLQALARKYVTTYDCKILYKLDNNNKEVMNNTTCEPLPDVYGRIKYIPKIKNDENSKINYFLHVGRLNDFNMLNKSILDKNENISYSNYKNNLKDKK